MDDDEYELEIKAKGKNTKSKSTPIQARFQISKVETTINIEHNY